MSDFTSNDGDLSIQEAESIAQKHGVALSPQDYADMYAVMEERKRQLEQDTTNAPKGWVAILVEGFNRFYPKFLKTLGGIGDVFITVTQTLMIAFGVPVLLLMLMIVEQQRVYHGIVLFEVAEHLAQFSATVLVLANLVFEVLISWKENQIGYKEPPKKEFSFRIFLQRWDYIRGKSSNWQPREKSPANRFKVVLRLVTSTILTLALAGSMRSIIQQVQGNWVDAIRFIVMESSLLQIVTWSGGLLFAFAAVLSAQALSQYVAQKVIEVMAIMQSSTQGKAQAVADVVGMTGAAFLIARIKERQRERRVMATASALTTPVSGMFHVVPETLDTETPQTFKNATVSGVSETVKQPSKTLQKAIDWLKANPGHGLTVRRAAEMAEVSPATMQRAMKQQERQ